MLVMEQGTLDFQLPAELEAHEPPEARGVARDHVRLLVSHLEDDAVEHRRAQAVDERTFAAAQLRVGEASEERSSFSAIAVSCSSDDSSGT